jgi:hypothetical protein
MRYTASTASKLAGAASILTLTTLMAANPAQAASATGVETLQHFIDCAGWLINDPAKHAQNCDPGHTFFVSGSVGSGAVPDPEDAETY